MIKWMGNTLYVLLIFVVLVDPTNTIFRVKDVLFVALVGFNMIFLRPDFRYVPLIVLPVMMVTAGFLMGEMQGNLMDNEMLLGTYKGFAMLVLLLWTRQYNVISLAKWPAVIAALMMTVLYVLVSSNELIEEVVYDFTLDHNEFILMSRRYFLGVEVYGMYLKSLSCVGIVAVLYYHRFIMTRERWFWAFLASVFFTFTYLISGTRMTMLAPFVLIGVIVYVRVNRMRYVRYFYYPLLALLAIAFAGFVLVLATESGEISNDIKYAHLSSYGALFYEHPQFLLFGQGPATWFYSAGFKEMTLQTEWTYIELLRNYGIFMVGILCVLFYPVLQLYRHRHDSEKLSVLVAYLVYLITAGTNPLLINSTGMMAILMIYSYTCRLEGSIPPSKQSGKLVGAIVS